MISPFVNQSITQLNNTSLVSTVAVPDLLYNGTLITADTYWPLEVCTVIAVIRFVPLFPGTTPTRWYERRPLIRRQTPRLASERLASERVVGPATTATATVPAAAATVIVPGGVVFLDRRLRLVSPS